jgi:hypothetical protein
MSFTICQLITNIDGNLLGSHEIDYGQLPKHCINLGKFEVPFNLLVTFTHQSLLRDYGRGEEISEGEVLQYWQDAKDELISAGSVEDYLNSMQLM